MLPILRYENDGPSGELTMNISEAARDFFEACETGKGWSGCKPWCHDDASFSCQADTLANVTTVADYAEWMKGLLGPIPDGAYQLQDPKKDPTKRGHRGQKAFKQVALMKYWRDANRDKYLDFDGEEVKGIFATNGHYMGTKGRQVDKWSAGCWGATVNNLNKIFKVAELQIKHGYGDKFSFSLLHENNF